MVLASCTLRQRKSPLQTVLRPERSPLTKAKSTKSVAALIEPDMRKYNSTLMHLPPSSGASVPASVSQKAWIGTHWNTETRMQAMVRDTTKTKHQRRIRRNWTMGKMRYWKRMLQDHFCQLFCFFKGMWANIRISRWRERE